MQSFRALFMKKLAFAFFAVVACLSFPSSALCPNQFGASGSKSSNHYR